MRVISETALRHVMQAIVAAAHSSTDHNGVKVPPATIEEPQLRSAALVALFVTTGEAVVTEIPRMDRRTG